MQPGVARLRMIKEVKKGWMDHIKHDLTEKVLSSEEAQDLGGD